MHWGSSSSLGLMNRDEKIRTALRTSTFFHLGREIEVLFTGSDSTKSSYHSF